MTESPTAVTCPASNPAAGGGSAVILGVVVVVVVGGAVVTVTGEIFGSASAVVVGGSVVAFGAAVAVVGVLSATVVWLVECTGGSLGAPARRAGAAAQPEAMIP